MRLADTTTPAPPEVWTFLGDTAATWLGVIGTIAAAVVAVVALLRDIRTRNGLRQVVQQPSRDVPGGSQGALPGGGAPVVPLRLFDAGRKRRSLTNMSESTLIVTRVEQVDGGQDVYVARELPAELAPAESLTWSVERSLASPAVIAVDVEWTQDDVAASRRFFVD